MKKCKVCPRVVDGSLIFYVVEQTSKLTGNDIPKNRLLHFNIQRFVIRKSQIVNGFEVKAIENKYNRFAKP